MLVVEVSVTEKPTVVLETLVLVTVGVTEVVASTCEEMG